MPRSTEQLSREYLEEAWKLARTSLPGWAFAMIHQQALPRSGGRAAARDLGPTSLEKLALEAIRPASLRRLEDEDLRAVWLRLHQWYASAKRRGQAIEEIVNAAIWTLAELRRRGVEPGATDLAEEAGALTKAAEDRSAEVLGVPGELPAWLEALRGSQPEEVLLVRDFVALAGSAAVCEEPEDLDLVVRAEYLPERNAYSVDATAAQVALRRFLAPQKERGLHYVPSAAGPFTDNVPLYDLILRRRELGVQRVEPQPPSYDHRGRTVKDAEQPQAAAPAAAPAAVPAAPAPASPATADEKAACLKSIGPVGAPLAFIGAVPDPVAWARGEPFAGPAGETLRDLYLAPLGLRREQVVLSHAVPQLLTTPEGAPREPTPEEVEAWQEWLMAELERLQPQQVIALGRTAQAALGKRATEVLPHPHAVRHHGDRGEVGRKLRRIKARIDKAELPQLGEDLGEDTLGALAWQGWENGWQDLLPTSGTGRFVYQHHWRGLSEDEATLDEEALMSTDRSLHGDLRLEGEDGLWGWTVLLGQVADNRGREQGDKLIDWREGDNLELAPKPVQPKEWLGVGGDHPYVSGPGETGATSQKWSKFYQRDSGTYRLGVARQHAVEVFLDGGHLKGRYLFVLAPVGGRRRWLIDKPTDQTPAAERDDLAAVLAELKRKGQKWLIWAKPGERPVRYQVSTGKAVKASTIPISKVDLEKRIVYGVVLDPYQVDAQGDWIPPGSVEDTAHRWMKRSRVIGLRHQGPSSSYPVESWLVPYPSPEDYRKALAGKAHRCYRIPFGSDKIHSGAWVVGTKLGEADWQAYQDGELNAYSIGGMGHRTPVSVRTMPEVVFVDLVEGPIERRPLI